MMHGRDYHTRGIRRAPPPPPRGAVSIDDIADAFIAVFREAHRNGEIDFPVEIEVSMNGGHCNMKVTNARTGRVATVPDDVARRAFDAHQRFAGLKVERALGLWPRMQCPHCGGQLTDPRVVRRRCG
jgi:hypothetical protein